MDVTFVAELESIFRESFLKSAPLYQAAGKIKLPYEDIKGTTVLYRGSLREESRPIDNIADYELFKWQYTQDEIRGATEKLASTAGAATDGLIRIENVRSIKESDPRQTNNLRVVDVFEHADGRRNFQLILKLNSGPTISDPADTVKGWLAYRFYFAAASIKQEYKN